MRYKDCGDCSRGLLCPRCLSDQSSKYEDLTRHERAKLLVKDPDAYMALLGPEHYYLLLDGVARLRPYEPESEKAENPAN